MKFLGNRDLDGMFPYSRATRYRMIKRGEFPKPVRISPGRVGWPDEEIAAYQVRLMSGAPPDNDDTQEGLEP